MFSAFANIFVMSAFLALHTFPGGQCFLCRNTYGSHFCFIREIYFQHPWAKGFQEPNLQEQQAHFLAEKKREEKAEEVPLMATSPWENRHGQSETHGWLPSRPLIKPAIHACLLRPRVMFLMQVDPSASDSFSEVTKGGKKTNYFHEKDSK